MIKIFENLNLKDLDSEIWKTIEEYPDYQVSNFGRVKSFKKYHGKNERVLKQQKDSDDYFIVGLCKNGISKTKLIHRLVYETFKGKLEEGCDAHHINENKENNIPENLESKEHGKHTKYHKKGESHPLFGKKHSEKTINKMSEKKKGKIFSQETRIKMSESHKLSNQKYIDIKIDIEKGDLTKVEMAKKHKVSTSTVYNIKIGRIQFYL